MGFFKNIQEQKLNNSRKKLKTQDKNSRFRQSQKRSLPKTRPKKSLAYVLIRILTKKSKVQFYNNPKQK